MLVTVGDCWLHNLLESVGLLGPKMAVTRGNFWESWFIVFLITCGLSFVVLPLFSGTKYWRQHRLRLQEIQKIIEEEIRNRTFRAPDEEQEKTMDPLEFRMRRSVYDILKREGRI